MLQLDKNLQEVLENYIASRTNMWYTTMQHSTTPTVRVASSEICQNICKCLHAPTRTSHWRSWLHKNLAANFVCHDFFSRWEKKEASAEMPRHGIMATWIRDRGSMSAISWNHLLRCNQTYHLIINSCQIYSDIYYKMMGLGWLDILTQLTWSRFW